MPWFIMNLFKEEMDSEYKSLGLKDLSKNVRVLDQTGRSSIPIDSKRKALAPGKRISSSGNVYYEYRKSRSDVPGKMV